MDTTDMAAWYPGQLLSVENFVQMSSKAQGVLGCNGSVNVCVCVCVCVSICMCPQNEQAHICYYTVLIW